MARPKIDFQKIMLEKGEKYGLIACAVVMVLLMVFGITTALGSASQEEKAKKINQDATTLRTQVQSTAPGANPPPPVDPSILQNVDFRYISAEQHRNGEFFISQNLESRKRASPSILTPTEYQVDFFRGVYYTYGFTYDANGERENIYVIIDDKKAQRKGVDRVGDRFKGGLQKGSDIKKPGPPMGGGGGPGRPGGAGPMGPGGAGPMGPGGGPMGPGMPSGGGNASAASTETLKTIQTVKLTTFLDKEKGAKYIPAQFIRPLQCVIVQASFPLKQQMEAFKTALRYDTLGELIANKSDEPQFKGFTVQRKIHYPNGQDSEWEDYKWTDKYKPIYQEKIDEDQAEPEDRKIVVPDESTELYIPLPKLARGEYPPLNLEQVTHTIEKAKVSGNTNRHSARGSGKLEGGGSVFDRGGSSKSKEDATKDDKGAAKDVEVNDAILIRFMDVDVQPGYSYEYRIQMHVANPNFGKKELVSQPDHAEKKELVSEYSTVSFKDGDKMTSVVKVPLDKHVYAFAPDSKEQLKVDHARVQVHSWLPHIRIDRSRVADEGNLEPLGEWLVDDIQIGRGQFVIGTKNIKVPIWSAAKNMYEFVEFSTARSATGAKIKGALPINISAMPQMVVDFDGGKGEGARHTIRVKGRSPVALYDESGLEVLFLGADNKLHVHSYWTDMADQQRFEREVAWTSWLKSVKDATETKPGTKDPFDKGGPGPMK